MCFNKNFLRWSSVHFSIQCTRRRILWYQLKRLHLNTLLYGLINIGYFYYYLCILNNVNITSRCAREINYITMLQMNTERPFTVVWLQSVITTLCLCNTNLAIPQPQVVNFVVEPLYPVVYLFTIVPWWCESSECYQKELGLLPQGKYDSFVHFQVTEAIKSLNWGTAKLVLWPPRVLFGTQ